MKNTRYIILAALVALLPSLFSCGSKGNAGDETASEIEVAQNEGRETARVFVNTVWKDTMELQDRLLSARARSSKYEMAGKPHCREAFDSAFVSTIRTVRPDVAKHLAK